MQQLVQLYLQQLDELMSALLCLFMHHVVMHELRHALLQALTYSYVHASAEWCHKYPLSAVVSTKFDT